jgi:CHAT domain-containing protein
MLKHLNAEKRVISRFQYFPLLLALASLSSWAESPTGVVVTGVANYSEGSNAGLQPGDLLTSWSQGETRGAILSPFDLMRVEVEKAPLGTVTIEGSTQSQKRSWKLGQQEWGIETRPSFTATNLALYLRGRQLVRTGNTKEAYAVWNSIALTDPRRPWIYSWCAGDAAADLMGERKRGSGTDLLYGQALTRVKGDPVAQLFLRRNWVPALEQRGDWEMVTRLLRRALSNSESFDDQGLLTASALRDLALVTEWRRDLKTSDQLYRRALAIDKKLAPESLATARTLISLAMVSLNRGEERTAEQFLEEAEPLIEKAGANGPDFAMLNGELATVTLRRGDLNQARKYLVQSQELLETHWPDSLDLARILSSLAFISSRQGDLSGAELQLRRAFEIYDKNPVAPVLGFNLSNDLAVLAYERYDFKSAEKYGIQTETMLTKIAPNSLDHAGCLMNLGLYATYSDHPIAAQHYWSRALAIVQRVAPGSLEQAKILTELAAAANKRGDLMEAGRYAATAQQILETIGPNGVDLADTLQQLAETARNRGDLQQAEQYIRRSVAIQEKLAPASSAFAESIADLAKILRAKGETGPAAEEYGRAITALESEMGRLGGNEASRSEFRSSHDDIYKEYADLLVQQGKSDRAFEIAERSRDRSLLEMLAEANVDFHEHVDASLRAQEQALRVQFAKESDYRLRLLMGMHSDEQVKSSDAKISNLLARFATVESEIRGANPSYAQLTQPRTTTIREVQEHLLDPDTLLLEYCLGDNRSYLWLLSADSAFTYVLPGRAKIESEARRAYEAIARPKQANPATTTIAELTTTTQAMEALSHTLLGPVRDKLGQQRLLIVADGALNYVPFAALPIPGKSPRTLSPLIVDHEIISIPSASVLMTLQRERAWRQPPPRTVAVLADPVFDSRDPRLKLSDKLVQPASHQPTAAASKESFAALRSIDLARVRWADTFGIDAKRAMSFPRLPYSRREAQEIIAATPKGQSLEALDFRASRSLAMSSDLAQYKILHFATHGLVDATHPELSGILLSLFDEQGAPQIGLLTLQDIYNLNLPVDMVVLSACETALGKEVKGEGLMGLTRGFMYAGASRVVATLWKVNDVASASLMSGFYRAMEQDHLPPAAALRKAQVEMRKDRRWSAPYYWAGFELQGEWK